ncbi:coiled-coil domain-containing protein 43-like [Diadema setosum]|uniref:coiled-coil domain-containing protein 43-like n=1 Tax=Diadema setosum TaxID=31175 RepID=UPI003B3B479D
MAEAAPGQNFGEWLSTKLEQLSIDQDVFGSYISSIVETDDSNEEEKSEALNGILCEILDNSVDETCQEILQKWKELSSADEAKQVNGDASVAGNADVKMAAIMERHAATQVPKVTRTPTESKEKAALLARFAEVSEGEDDEDYEEEDYGGGGGGGGGGGLDDFFMRNTNKEDVDKQEREKREKAKAETAKKKAQDKLQREQQKQKAQDRKDKEKKRTQKQERRR